MPASAANIADRAASLCALSHACTRRTVALEAAGSSTLRSDRLRPRRRGDSFTARREVWCDVTRLVARSVSARRWEALELGPGRTSARVRTCRDERSRTPRRFGWAGIECDGRARVLVGFAIKTRGQSSIQTKAIRTAAALRCMLSFGGAEAPEQLLPYLERRHGISNQTGSMY
jgi:hypothetical protein